MLSHTGIESPRGVLRYFLADTVVALEGNQGAQLGR